MKMMVGCDRCFLGFNYFLYEIYEMLSIVFHGISFNLFFVWAGLAWCHQACLGRKRHASNASRAVWLLSNKCWDEIHCGSQK